MALTLPPAPDPHQTFRIGLKTVTFGLVPATAHSPRRLVIVDDDLLSREILSLLAADAGFEVQAFDSGESALSFIDPASAPLAVLADMQMPGVTGNAFAEKLRATCGPDTILLAMSGTQVPSQATSAFHAFLLKPFTIDDLCRAIDGTSLALSESAAGRMNDDSSLNPAIYDAFTKSLTPEQLQQLYAMSLDDADNRIRSMQKALEADDQDAYRRAAHSIKGGCGMVGASELASLAADMEENGYESVDNSGPLTQFLAASAKLRRILEALQN